MNDYSTVWLVLMLLIMTGGVAAFVVSAFRSPALSWTDSKWNLPVKVGGDPYSGLGGEWQSAGLVAQREWWSKVFAWGTVLGVMAFLCLLGAVREVR